MDEIDKAQANNEVYQEAAMQAHFARRKDSGGIPAVNGFCEDCCKPIPGARMAANPQATRCIECQTEKEREDKNGHD